MAEQTSSIGIAWPPIGASNDRVRGFYDSFVEDEESADVFIDCYDTYRNDFLASSGASRLSIRAVVSVDLLPHLENNGLPIEGALPIRGNDNCRVIYVATNKPERVVSESLLAEHGQGLANVTAIQRDHKDNLETLLEKGFTPKIIDNSTPETEKSLMTKRFIELYGTFGYNGVEVEDLLNNPLNTIAYVEDEKGVVSTAMAERAFIQVSGFQTLEIAEITEAVTRVENRKQGLYRAISGYLVDALIASRTEKPLDIVYGESNLAMKGVLISAHQNGRDFSYFDGQKLGIQNPHFGILQQNFHVEDGTETRPYNDFALSYVPIK